MRTIHCTVAALVLGAACLAAEAPRQPGPAFASRFVVFFRGAPVGAEEVSVARSAEGTTISGTAALGPPLSLTVRHAEVRYSVDGRPLEWTVDGSIKNEMLAVHTVVSGTTATSDATQGMRTEHRTDQIAPDAVLLPNVFFGAYEALAERLAVRKTGDELAAYIAPQAQIPIRVGAVIEETIRTPDGAVRVRRFTVHLLNPGRPVDAEVWVDSSGHLVRLLVPTQFLDIARNDIVSVSSRRETVTHPGDEQIAIMSIGFTLAGTLSKPASITRGQRLPAVVLVSGSDNTDRDESIGGVPVFGQLASALADAGLVVVRYDKRGVGQSGGRTESVTLGDYAEDVRAAVTFLRKRKDVDSKRIAVVGFSEGGAVALEAASRDGDIEGVVLLNTPGTTGAELVLEQQRRALSGMSIPEAEKQAKIDLQKKIIQAVISGKGWGGIPANVRNQADTPWFQSWLMFDPARVVRNVKQPMLIVQAALDHEIVPENGRRLEKLARARKGKSAQAVRLVEVPGVNHLLVNATTGEVDEYGNLPDKTINSQVTSAVAGWVKDLGRK